MLFLSWFLLYFVFQVLLHSNCNPSSASIQWIANSFFACLHFMLVHFVVPFLKGQHLCALLLFLLFLFQRDNIFILLFLFQKNITFCVSRSFFNFILLFLFHSSFCCSFFTVHFVVPFSRFILLFLFQRNGTCGFAIPFPKEQHLHFCCSFSKGTTHLVSAVPFPK